MDFVVLSPHVGYKALPGITPATVYPLCTLSDQQLLGWMVACQPDPTFGAAR
jgi:hypothetical protein